MELGTKIKSLRQAKSWSQAQVAERLNVSASTYRDWEEGRKIPAEMLIPVAALYGTSVSKLLGQRQPANEDLARGISSIQQGLEQILQALSKL